MDLRETSQAIRRSDNPAALLQLADSYIDMYNATPESFVLPHDHDIIRPIIEVFHNDLPGFVAYVKALRNVCVGVNYDAVHKFYRRVNTRLVQQVRRDRVERAIRVYERTRGVTYTAEERNQLAQKLEQHWGHLRLLMLESERNKGGLTVGSRALLLAKFWASIDKDIDDGELPEFYPS